MGNMNIRCVDAGYCTIMYQLFFVPLYVNEHIFQNSNNSVGIFYHFIVLHKEVQIKLSNGIVPFIN